MNITINGESLDYTLEDEKNAGDVLSGIASWLEGSGMIVSGVEIDGRPAAMAEEGWKETSLPEISTIAIEAVSLREGRIRQLETARDYFVLLQKSVEGGDSESLEELSGGWPDLLRILPNLLEEGSAPVLLPHLEQSLASAGFPAVSGKVPDAAPVAAEAARMAAILESRRRETASPEDEARAAAKALAAMSDSLDDVAVHLQTGKDRQAMETIIVLTEMLQGLLRALSWTADTGAEEIVNEMTGILAELEDALKATDTVLIGDLLEYEIKPRLQELPEKLQAPGEAAT